jgi:hypothetical protein
LGWWVVGEGVVISFLFLPRLWNYFGLYFLSDSGFRFAPLPPPVKQESVREMYGDS